MTDDDRFERDLEAILREAAPDASPPSLRPRVRAALALAAANPPRRRLTPVIGAAAAAALILAVTIIGPRLVTAPGQTPGSSNASSVPRSSGSPAAVATVTPPTERPTPPLLAEPITHPGFLETGQLLTPLDGLAQSFDGRLLVTHSAGAAWRDITPAGAVPGGLNPFFLDPVHGWVSEFGDNQTTGLHIWRTSDSGMTWQHVLVPGPTSLARLGLVFLTPTLGWLAGDPGGQHPKPELRWTADGGATWSAPIDLAAATGFPTLPDLTFVDGAHGFMSGENLLRETTDGGRTWTDVKLGPGVLPNTPDPQVLRFDPQFVDPEHGFVQVTLRRPDRSLVARWVFSTDDVGATWDLALRDDIDRNWTFLDQYNWVALDGVHVWMTADGGKTIDVAASTGLPTPLQYADPTFVDPLHAWASAAKACPPGVYCSLIVAQLFTTSDGGRTWSPVGDCESRGGLFPCPSSKP
jgi:photosystem II stability/assembly factor-like uncharacterized protein